MEGVVAVLPDPRPGACRRFPFFVTFVVLYGLWVAAYWPALHRSWWYTDDYTLAELSGRDLLEWNVSGGRPLAAIWHYTLRWDRTAKGRSINVALRLCQGAFHTLTCVLIARGLWQGGGVVFPCVAVLPFLLWPFNTEAVLWRTPGAYAMAPALAVLGVLAVRAGHEMRRWWVWPAGVVACAYSVNFVQNAALAGGMVWLVLVAADALRAESPPWTRLAKEAALLGLGYVIGGIVSVDMVGMFHECSRGGVKFNWWYKWQGVKLFNDKFFNLSMYTPLVWWGQVVTGAAGLLAAVVAGVRIGRDQVSLRWGSPLAVACLLACLVVPYVGNLVVEDLDCSLRCLYISPIVLCGALAVLFRAAEPIRAGWVVAAAAGVLVAGYLRLDHSNALDCMRLFKSDRAAIERLEAFCAAHHTDRVVLLAGAVPTRLNNPYGLKYVDCGCKSSALATEWAAFRAVKWFSRLRPVHRDAVKELAARQMAAQLSANPGCRFFKVDGEDVVAVIP